MKAVLVNLGCKVNKYELDSIATILMQTTQFTAQM